MIPSKSSPARDLPRLSSHVVIDGDPADWGADGLDIRAFAENSGAPVDPGLLSAEARLGWTPRGVVALITIRTSVPWKEMESAMNGYNADSIEIILRDGHNVKNSRQAIIVPGMTDDHPEPRSYILGDRPKKEGATDAPDLLEVKRVRTASGCVVEVLFPWSALGFDAREGARCELYLKINKIIPGQNRHQLVWPKAKGGGFQALRLAEPGHSLMDTAAWIALDDTNRLGVNAVAPPSAAGKVLRLSRGDTELLRIPLQRDGERAVATGWIRPPAPGPLPLVLTLDGVQVAKAEAPDLVGILRQRMEIMARFPAWSEEDWVRKGLYIHVPAIFSGTALPAVLIPDAQLVRLAGIQDTRVDWFGPNGQRVTDAKIPGRYGAIITIHLSGADPIVSHQTCFRLPDHVQSADALSGLAHRVSGATPLDSQASALLADLGRKTLQTLADSTSAAMLLASLSEAAADGAPAQPSLRDQNWWYAVRTRFGDATTYRWFSLLPEGYDADPKKRWPAIIYLHGSGGTLPSDYEPFEKRSPDHDLIGWAKGKKLSVAIYALQSFGGWEPPAVLNALNHILATDRIDPDRVIIMGFSMGGAGTWDCAIDLPGHFAGAVPIAGGGGRVNDCSALAGHLPVWIFNGDADSVMQLDNAMKPFEALKAAGGDVKLTILPGIDHGGSQNATFETPGLWDWVLARHSASASHPQ